MSQTYFGSTVRMGSGTLTDAVDGGFTVLTQTTTATTDAATGSPVAVNAVVTIPASSQIVDIIIDTIVTPVVGGGTATEVNATVGTAAAGTQYSAAIDVIAGGRFRPTFTTAQLAAMDDVGTNQNVVMTVLPDGTIGTTQGSYRLTVVYAQKV